MSNKKVEENYQLRTIREFEDPPWSLGIDLRCVRWTVSPGLLA